MLRSSAWRMTLDLGVVRMSRTTSALRAADWSMCAQHEISAARFLTGLGAEGASLGIMPQWPGSHCRSSSSRQALTSLPDGFRPRRGRRDGRARRLYCWALRLRKRV